MLCRPALCCIDAYVRHTNHAIYDFSQIKKTRYEPLSIHTILKCLFCLKTAVFLNQFILDLRYSNMVGFFGTRPSVQHAMM